MKLSRVIVAPFLFFLISLPLGTGLTATAAQAALSQEQTYQGDTPEAAKRRAGWIEGAKKEAALTWWGILRPNEAQKIIDEFNKAYPFIKVTYWRGRGEEIATKLEAEYAGNRPNVDVCLGGSPENYPRWSSRGVIEKYIDIVPGIEKFNKRAYSKRGDWIIPAFAPKTPQYNTRLVSAAEAPKSWEELLDPKWKGQLGAEVESENWATLALSEGGWGIEKTEKFLTKLKEQKPRFIQGGSAAHSLLIAGEFKIMAMGNLRHVIISQGKNAPVDWVRVDPVLVTGPSLIFPKKAPHPQTARLFLEWVFSPKGRAIWADVTQNYVPGVPTPIAKFLDGMNLVIRTEEVEIKIAESGLIKKLDKLFLGVD